MDASRELSISFTGERMREYFWKFNMGLIRNGNEINFIFQTMEMYKKRLQQMPVVDQIGVRSLHNTCKRDDPQSVSHAQNENS